MKKIIVDTDLGSDCDDVMAIAIANIFHNKKECKVLSLTYTTSLKWGPICLDAINRYYSNNFPIGVTSREKFLDHEGSSKYASFLAKKFPSNNALFLDATTLVRQKLAQEDNQSVTLIYIGQLNNLSDLLDSPPDQYSDLNGINLVKNKVFEIVIMGGMFNDTGREISFGGAPYRVEFNLQTDLDSARNAFNKIPVQTTLIDFILGYKVKTGGVLLKEKDMNNPITFSYYHHQNSPRESWDPLTVYYGIKGLTDMFVIAKTGDLLLSTDGVTTIKENKNGLFRYLRFKKPLNEVETIIDDLVS